MKTVLAGRVKYTETKTVMLFFSKGNSILCGRSTYGELQPIRTVLTYCIVAYRNCTFISTHEKGFTKRQVVPISFKAKCQSTPTGQRPAIGILSDCLEQSCLSLAYDCNNNPVFQGGIHLQCSTSVQLR